MRFSLNEHVRGVHAPPISEVRSWAAQRSADAPALIDLCQAVPDYGPPADLLAHLRTQIDDPATCRYTPDEGTAGGARGGLWSLPAALQCQGGP